MAESQALPIVRDAGDLRRRLDRWRTEGLRIAFVPTMGALHEGHLSLVRRGVELADRVVASVFVNPTQFGPDEDFEQYPRDAEGDANLLEGAGCSLVFMPPVDLMYPPGASTFVEVEGPAAGFEGDERPGHFRGVATVVTLLFNLVRPDVAIFGQKDAQQLAVVRKLNHDLHLGVEIVGAPIVREADGLAMSSRNVYLDPDQRRAATVLHRALGEARRAVEDGERRADVLRCQIQEILATEPLGVLDYVAVVDGHSFSPIETLGRRSVIALAVRFGQTRLLDNIHLELD